MIKSTMQGLLVAAIALGSSASAIADDEDGGHLHGVWRMTRTPINCQSGQQVAPSFQAIMIFNEDGTLKSPARITVLHNGVLIQNNFELKGDTPYIGLPQYKAHGPAPLKLQAHGDKSEPISYRNIWLREL